MSTETKQWSAARADKALKALATAPQGSLAVIAFANPNSGGNKGKDLLASLADKSVNTKGIISIPLPPKKESQAEIVKILAAGWGKQGSGTSKARIICAGGDGTAAWCLALVIKELLKLGGVDPDNADLAAADALLLPGFVPYIPTLLMCPLGTGNDFSRGTGWGKTYPGNAGKENLKKWLDAATSPSAKTTHYDVWRASFNSKLGCKSTEEFYQPKLEPGAAVLMFLYFGVGYGAQTMAAFERTESQLQNKMVHGTNLLGAFARSSAEDFGVRCEVGCEVADPKIRRAGEVAVVNSCSYSGGLFEPWGEDSKGRKQQVFDKKLEVVAAANPSRGAMEVVTGAGYKKLGQNGEVKIAWQHMDLGPAKPTGTEKRGRYMQVDGEAFQCGGEGNVLFTFAAQIRVLIGPERMKRASCVEKQNL